MFFRLLRRISSAHLHQIPCFKVQIANFGVSKLKKQHLSDGMDDDADAADDADGYDGDDSDDDDGGGGGG
jgi:hypothetical protein